MADIRIPLQISVSHELFPANDPAHGTPHEMVKRVLTVRAEGTMAVFEQTDYGHPGRFNPWAARGVDARLQPRTAELMALCEAITPLL